MKAIKSYKGMDKGRISLKASLLAMPVNDSLTLSDKQFDVEYVRVKCCKLGRSEGRIFSVSHPIEAKDKIIITRKK